MFSHASGVSRILSRSNLEGLRQNLTALQRRTLFVAFAVMVIFSSFSVYSQPRVSVVEGTRIDLGRIDEGITIIKNVTVKNTGSDTLVISNVSTSCGCTVAQLLTKRIAPRDSTTLQINFYTKDIVGPSVRKQVFIRSNDSINPTVTITMVAAIRKLVEAEPGYLNFSRVKLDTTLTRIVVLRNNGDSTVTLTAVTVPDSQLTAHLSVKILPSHGTTTLTVSLAPKKRGKLLGEIEITTNSGRQPKITISYVGMVEK